MKRNRHSITSTEPERHLPIRVSWAAEFTTSLSTARRFKRCNLHGRCFSCYGRHRSSDCTRPKRCIECGDRHNKLLNCQPNRQLSAPTSTTRRASPPTSQMNPASANFTPQQGFATSTPTFLGHLHGNQGRFSSSTYVEVRDSTGAWHKIVAFLDTGSDTTLVRHSLAKRLGITGDDQVFRYGVAGGGVRSEKSARYALHVRPVHRDASIAYDISAMGIKVPAHDAPAIDSSLFHQYEYLQPARDCVPLAKEKIDLLVGYDQAFLISTLHTISSPTNEAQLPSAACTRLGWVLFGGQIQPPRAIARSAVHHVQRLIEDDIKKLFYSDVAGVKPTTACICSDKELAEAKFLQHARTTTSITHEGRVRVFMPWRDGYPEALPFNKEKTVPECISRRTPWDEMVVLKHTTPRSEISSRRDLYVHSRLKRLTTDVVGIWSITPSIEKTSPPRRPASSGTPPHCSRAFHSTTAFTKAPTYSTHSSHVFSLGVATESHSWEM